MQKKLFPIFSILLLLISLVAPGIQPVGAEGKEDKKFEDGTHPITVKVLNANSDDESIADGFIEDKAELIVKEGKNTVRMTITGSSMLKELTIEGVKAKTVGGTEDEEEDSRVVELEVKDLEKVLDGTTHVVVPGLYDENHNVRFDFDASSVPLAEDEKKKKIHQKKTMVMKTVEILMKRITTQKKVKKIILLTRKTSLRKMIR